MKKIFIASAILLASLNYACAQSETIQLNKPSATRNTDIMKAFQERRSTREFSTKALSHQDLSDLLWAANGYNRSTDKKRTAPSCMNWQDIDVYVCTAEGAYLYDAENSALKLVNKGDFRKNVAGRQASVAAAPVYLILVSNTEKTGQSGSGPLTMQAIDAGLVSENISLFCSGAGLVTVVRGSMDKEALKKDLKLKDTQVILLNHPVGYKK